MQQKEKLQVKQERQKELQQKVETVDLTQHKSQRYLSPDEWSKLNTQQKRKIKNRQRKTKSAVGAEIQGQLTQLSRSITQHVMKTEQSVSSSKSINTRLPVDKQDIINQEHSFAPICKEIAEKNIQENPLNSMIIPKAIQHGYDTNRWNFTIHDCSDPLHIFAHLKDDRTVIAKIMKRYVKDSWNEFGRSNEEKEYENRVKRHVHVLGTIPMLKFQTTREELRNGNAPFNFNRRMSMFEGTQFEDYMESILPLLPSLFSYFAVDANNKLLFVYLHNFVSESEQLGMLHAAVELLVTNGKRSPNDPRHTEDNAEACHLTDWSMQGQPDSPCISLDVVGKGGRSGSYKLESSVKFTKSLRRTRLQMSSLLEVISPEQHAMYHQAAYNKSTIAYRQLLRACNQDVFLGCVLNNGRCKNHRDWLDIVNGLSCMTPLGYFNGRNVVLPQLGVQILYQPGNMFMCSTELLEHFITAWTGYRLGTVHSSQQCHTRETAAEPHKNIAPITKRILIKSGVLESKPIEKEKKRRIKEFNADLPPIKRKKK
jgi:hypothetical protein